MSKDNPKLIRAMKDGKAPFEYLVLDVLEEDAHVHALGGRKYGIFNWRKDHIKASTYKAAILRHFIAWFGGEDIDPESNKSHLAHIRACCAILRDSQMRGTLIDDRHYVESIVDQDTGAATGMDQSNQGFSGDDSTMKFAPRRDPDGVKVNPPGTVVPSLAEVRQSLEREMVDTKMGTLSPIDTNYDQPPSSGRPHLKLDTLTISPHFRETTLAALEPGIYVQFDDVELITVVGPFGRTEESKLYALENPANFAGLRSIIEVK